MTSQRIIWLIRCSIVAEAWVLHKRRIVFLREICRFHPFPSFRCRKEEISCRISEAETGRAGTVKVSWRRSRDSLEDELDFGRFLAVCREVKSGAGIPKRHRGTQKMRGIYGPLCQEIHRPLEFLMEAERTAIFNFF